MHLVPVLSRLFGLALATLAGLGHAAGAHDHGHAQGRSPAAHQHGGLRLDLVLDGDLLTITLDAPLDSLLGYERAPRTAAERRAAEQLLAGLRAPAGLIEPEAAAGCRFESAEVEAPVLDAAPATRGEGHADLEATLRWRCARPEALRGVELAGLLKRHPRIVRIEAQVVTPAGQFRPPLRRPQTRLGWGR